MSAGGVAVDPLEARGDGPALVSGRDPQCRHRAGLYARDTHAAGGGNQRHGEHAGHRSPRLVSTINGEPVAAPLLEPVPGSPENWEAVHEGMREVVHRHAAATQNLAKGIQYEMAGKTGTAQVIGIAQNAVYNEEEVAERHRHHGLFIAFAPFEAPTIAVAIIVENGGGSSAASPIARKVIDTWLLGDAG